MTGADTNTIIDQVNKCPTGALSWHYNNQEEKNAQPTETE